MLSCLALSHIVTVILCMRSCKNTCAPKGALPRSWRQIHLQCMHCVSIRCAQLSLPQRHSFLTAAREILLSWTAGTNKKLS